MSADRGHLSEQASVRLQAAIDVEFLTPEGSRLWVTTLLPDRDTNEGRQRLSIVATADTEAGARQTLSLIALRFRAALEAVEESDRV